VPSAVWGHMVHRHWHAGCQDGAEAVSSGCITTAAPDLRSTNRSTGTGDLAFDLITSHAVLQDAWVLLGELDKYHLRDISTGDRNPGLTEIYLRFEIGSP
jgi:hypothetical protein